MTLLELLVKPKSLGLEEVCEQYITTLKSYPNLQLIDFNLEMAVLGAEIRAKYRVRTPDAIQLASALASDPRYFSQTIFPFPGRFSSQGVVYPTCTSSRPFFARKPDSARNKSSSTLACAWNCRQTSPLPFPGLFPSGNQHKRIRMTGKTGTPCAIILVAYDYMVILKPDRLNYMLSLFL
ncbi:hypothetical protein MHOCP_07270 [Moorella humiferrea]|uniref:type II toxin-antitoxin system VapC family toxin n=1 Tax=Neomoorella humiferrea TaxID=676965 RepID=UPI003243E248